jgi:SAM-dependent methyltransferase
MTVHVDTDELTEKVQRMYRAVATEPRGDYHFELGRSLAERLRYPAQILDRIPAAAIESFAGVGYFFDLADLRAGERVVDLGSGSGTDAFFAAAQVGDAGTVVGVDFTAEQLEGPPARRRGRFRPRPVPPGAHRAFARRGRGRRLRDLQRRDQPLARQAAGYSPGRHACSDRAGAWRSPTSSPSGS